MDLGDFFDWILYFFSSPFLGIVLFIGVMTGVFYINSELWVASVIAMVTYLITDFVRDFFVRGGNGVVIVPFLGKSHEMNAHGHGFTAFFLYVVLASPLLARFAENLISGIETSISIEYVAVFNALIVSLVYADFFVDFIYSD